MVEILLSVDESANVVNAVDEEGWAPIHSAASIGNVTIVEMLLSKGSNKEIVFIHDLGFVCCSILESIFFLF